MTHVGHLFDASTGWEQRVGVSQLMDRLPGDRYTSVLAAIDAAGARALRRLSRPIDILPRFGEIAALSAPAVSRFVERRGIDLIHTWGVHAAAAARGLPHLPLVVQLFDPLAATREIQRLRALLRPEKFAVLCSSQIVRRRLIEGGFPAELAVLVRPGVDFALINRCRRSTMREQLGLGGTERVVIVPQPLTRSGGQFEAVYATMQRNHLSGGFRVLLPGASREQRRIVHFARNLPFSAPITVPDDPFPFEELVAVSDILLITPRGDMPTTSIAWAMAAGAAVIGTAVYSIAEMIANKVNGLLFKQVPGRSMATAISRLLMDRASQDKAKEVARAQAYEIFGLRRYVEQTMQVYENLLAGAPPAEGITDSAIDA